jgi:hypothetical protein
MKVLDIVLRGGAEIRRIVSDDACAALLSALEARVGAVPLDAAGKPRRRKTASKPCLLRQSDVGGHPFYVDPEEIAALTVAEFELKDF